MTFPTVFGRILPRAAVEHAVLDTLKLWAPTYLAEMERQTGRDPGVLEPVKAWRRVSRFPTDLPEENTPYVAVVSPGSSAPPRVRSANKYVAQYTIGVGVLCAARDPETARDKADLYAAALTAIVLHQPTLGGLAAHVAWVGFDSRDSPSVDVTHAALVNTFTVDVEDVITRAAGPDVPIPDPDPQHPYPPPEPFETAEIDVALEDIAS